MALNVLDQAHFTGPALPEPFVRLQLEKELTKHKLLPHTTGIEGEQLQQTWDTYRRILRELVSQGGAVRVRNHVLEPLISRLGYVSLDPAPDVQTREGQESGGYLFVDSSSRQLRAWCTALAEDLDAPARRGYAYRFSHTRIAQRVLLAAGEQVGLLTNGLDLRILISNPAGRDSEISIPIDPYWKRSRSVPDTYRFLLALASPDGVQVVPDLIDKARLQQAQVTKELRVQARQAIEKFIQEVLDHPANQGILAAYHDRQSLPRQLWHEGLVIIYRLLFILKLESSDDTAQAFSFASNSLWRNTYSPGVALAGFARSVLDEGAETGHLLEDGVRVLFRMFAAGLHASELNVKPLGGALFGAQATPLLSELRWNERAVAHVLDRLLWTPKRRGVDARQRVHYGPLDVKDLGRVYEALLELEPGVAGQTMCRLRRQKLEVVVPVVQGEKYRPVRLPDESNELDAKEEEDEEVEENEEEEDEKDTNRGRKTKVEWIEEIPTGRFYLRAGLGRKSSGSFYTPDSFVTFLVQETLGPLVEQVSPKDDPHPLAILSLKVLDDAGGSGHFLVETDRFLGDRLYEACRLCDEKALEAERRAEKTRNDDERAQLLAEAATWRQRVADLPDPNDELVLYLPSRAPEREESGLSQRNALVLCKRLVAVHCLYGVDKNPLAVELARLALWIETQSEGLPLTFLDHRIVVGDSLTGPFLHHLLTLPGSQQPIEGLYSQGLSQRLTAALQDALVHVRDLETSIGVSEAEIQAKQAAKARLDRALAPFRVIAAAWAGGVMLGPEKCDDEDYLWLVRHVAETGALPEDMAGQKALQAMIARGLGVDIVPPEREALFALLASGQCIPALAFDLAFPEVFYPTGNPWNRRGFHATLGNPPWDKIRPKAREFFAAFDFAILDAPTKRERSLVEQRLKTDPHISSLHSDYLRDFDRQHRIHDRLFKWQVVEVNGRKTGGDPELARLFLERNAYLMIPGGMTGVVVPSAFHANEGATGVRRLYLMEMGLRCCYSFENRRKLFEIHRSFKFALVVAQRHGPTKEFDCAFYLHDDEWLFGQRRDHALRFTMEFVRETGGQYLSFLEPRHRLDHEITAQLFATATPFDQFASSNGIHFSRELDTTDDAWRFRSIQVENSPQVDIDYEMVRQLNADGFLVLAEGKMFNQFEDRWGESPRYMVPIALIGDKLEFIENSRYYRVSYRTISASTNERTGIFCLLPPGYITARSSPCDGSPRQHHNAASLEMLAYSNSYAFDFMLRQIMSSMTVNYFFLERVPVPTSKSLRICFIAHEVLRLTCNHAGYETLWREQLGGTWRESIPSFTWPVLVSDDARWAVRAAVDAVVAQAYGLNREQYVHVLSTFSHKSYPQAPILCLARFDELHEIGLEAFTRTWDPYWDIPLNESLPKPVIELPTQNLGDKKQLKLGIS